MDLSRAFHPFDIRGEYPAVVDETLAFRLGKVLAENSRGGLILVGSDNRHSSPRLREALLGGIRQANGGSVDLREIPTPVLYFAAATLNCSFGVMITASHIGEIQNGFKLVKSGGLPFNEAEVESLRRQLIVASDNPLSSIPEPPSDSAGDNVIIDYLARLKERFATLSYPGKLILDSGTTIASGIIKRVFSGTSLDWTLLTSERELNPLLPGARENLGRAVLEGAALLGIIWDGDADRVIFVDKKGEIIPQAYVLGLIAKNYPKAALDMRAGFAAYTTDIVAVPSWAQNLKFAMEEDPKIGFAGEMSGHLIFREWFGIDDGIFGALRFLEITQKLDLEREISEMHKKHLEIEEQNLPLPLNFVVALEKLADYYREKGAVVSIVDGVSVATADFKFNLRQSLTEPLLRLNLEARSNKSREQVLAEIKAQLNV